MQVFPCFCCFKMRSPKAVFVSTEQLNSPIFHKQSELIHDKLVQEKPLKSSKTLALYLEEVRVYRPESKQVSVFENESFFQFHGLNPDNDWVRLAKLIPWAELERRYAQTFDSKLGNVGKPARMALGALVIRERYGFSDEDTVQKIRMNPYLQFFLGLSAQASAADHLS